MSTTAVGHVRQQECVLPQVRAGSLVIVVVFVLCLVWLGYDPWLAIGGIIAMIIGILRLIRH